MSIPTDLTTNNEWFERNSFSCAKKPRKHLETLIQYKIFLNIIHISRNTEYTIFDALFMHQIL